MKLWFGPVYSEWPWTMDMNMDCLFVRNLQPCTLAGKVISHFILDVEKHSIYMKPLVQVYM